MENPATSSSVHVAICPFPILGHVNSMLKLAELLLVSGDILITFVNSEHNHRLLLRHSEHQATRFAGVRFVAIPDGLPKDHPRNGAGVSEMFSSMEKSTKPVFREVLSRADPPVDCVIGDGALAFVTEVAEELGVNLIHFRTASACSFWVYFCIPDMIAAGELPMKGSEDMDDLTASVPGMETFLRYKDLPSFLQVSKEESEYLQYISAVTRSSARARGLILNTFEDLEGPILSHIRERCPNIYSVGPLHHHVRKRLLRGSQPSTNSLREVDRSCISWLDEQPERSVLYVSFGSLAVMTKGQTLEIWHGLVNCGKRFLWILRPDSVEREVIPPALTDRAEERGRVAAWAPQEDVLGHRAIGGFLTHGGWNSTLESITAGIPMLFWPFFADQPVNSRFASEVWRIGLDMKDVCDRGLVERLVKDLMVERREEFAKAAARMAQRADKSVSKGGSSYKNLDRLVRDIISMRR